MSPLDVLGERERRDLPALHLEPGGAEDRVLSFGELHDAVAHRAARLRHWSAADSPGSTGPGRRRIVAVEAPRGSLLLIELLAALEVGLHAGPGPSGLATLAVNNAWWPRERDAVLEQVRPAWVSAGADPDRVPAAVGLRHEPDVGPADPAGDGAGPAGEPVLWLASTGTDSDPTPYTFDEDQVRSWFVGDSASGQSSGPAGRVLVTGEIAHAPVLRAALSALAAGAELRITDRTHLAAQLALGPYDRVVTTPLLLRRALRQLQRRHRHPAAVGSLILHQGPVRPHERTAWPQRFDATVHSWLSATEAGGWLLQDGRAPDGLTVRLDPDGTVRTDGPLSAAGSASRRRPEEGWPSGDRAVADPDGRLHWQGRHRDRFQVDGTEVDPVAVEAILAAHPLIAEIAIAPRPHPERGNQVVAVLVPADPEWPPFLEDLADVAATLPPSWRPEALAIVEDLPTNAAGALHRRLVNYEEASR